MPPILKGLPVWLVKLLIPREWARIQLVRREMAHTICVMWDCGCSEHVIDFEGKSCPRHPNSKPVWGYKIPPEGDALCEFIRPEHTVFGVPPDDMRKFLTHPGWETVWDKEPRQ